MIKLNIVKWHKDRLHIEIPKKYRAEFKHGLEVYVIKVKDSKVFINNTGIDNEPTKRHTKAKKK